MSPSITPNVDPEQLARRLKSGLSSAELRSSESRRLLLERWGEVLSEEHFNIGFDPQEGSTARVKLGEDTPQVKVPSYEIEQSATNIDRKPYDLLIQRALTLHEIGHILYTDQQKVTDVMKNIPLEQRDAFHLVFNSLEDGAIENQLRQEFNLSGELDFANANFRYDSGYRQYGLLGAIQLACLDLAVHDSGLLTELLDQNNSNQEFKSNQIRSQFEADCLPIIKNAVPGIVTEPDPKKRVDLIYDLWKQLTPELEDFNTPDQSYTPKGNAATDDTGDGNLADQLGDIDEGDIDSQITDITSQGTENTNNGDSEGSKNTDLAPQSDNKFGGEKDQPSGSGHESGDASGSGSESESVSGGDADSSNSDTSHSDGHSTSSVESDLTDIDGSPVPLNTKNETESVPENDNAAGNSPSGSGGESQDNADTTSVEDDESQSSETAIKDKYDSLVENQEQQQRDEIAAFEDEIDALSDALDRIDSSGEAPREVDIVDEATPRDHDWATIRSSAQRIERILDQQLQQERKSTMNRGKRRGKVDPRRLTRLATSDPRIFRQEDNPDEKEYAVVIVLDRSGSMKSTIEAAEEATVTLAYALDRLEIDVCVMDMYRSRPRIAKPFKTDVETNRNRLLTADTSGGTPLSKILRVARERLDGQNKHPFMIVITDGQPDNEDKYLEELRQTRFPVVGLYVDLSASSVARVSERMRTSASYYDLQKFVIDSNNLTNKLRDLCRDVMF